MVKTRIAERKRNFLNGILQETEKHRSQGSIKNLFKTIKKYNGFYPILKAIKDNNEKLLMK
jgi:hypothetical protein